MKNLKEVQNWLEQNRAYLRWDSALGMWEVDWYWFRPEDQLGGCAKGIGATPMEAVENVQKRAEAVKALMAPLARKAIPS